MTRKFTLQYDIGYTITITKGVTISIEAASPADAKRKAEEECREAESGDDWRAKVDAYHLSGATCEGADVDFFVLQDDETGDEYESFAIEEGDEEPFAEEGEDEEDEE